LANNVNYELHFVDFLLILLLPASDVLQSIPSELYNTPRRWAVLHSCPTSQNTIKSYNTAIP